MVTVAAWLLPPHRYFMLSHRWQTTSAPDVRDTISKGMWLTKVPPQNEPRDYQTLTVVTARDGLRLIDYYQHSYAPKNQTKNAWYIGVPVTTDITVAQWFRVPNRYSLGFTGCGTEVIRIPAPLPSVYAHSLSNWALGPWSCKTDRRFDPPNAYANAQSRPTDTTVTVSWPVVATAGLVLTSSRLWNLLRRFVARSRTAAGLCPQCRYDIKALPICPECGTPRRA